MVATKLVALTLSSVLSVATGHAYVLEPPPRAAALIQGDVRGVAGSCATGICYWFNEGCKIGCPSCNDTSGGSCDNPTTEATLPMYARTYNRLRTHCGVNPWCAPGSAPVVSPCGVAGGGPDQYNLNGRTPPPGSKQGDDGRSLPELERKTYWTAGAVEEIHWSMIANHGGGYQYRLCKKSAWPTEECFQQMPLEFAADEQWIQYCQNDNQYPSYAGTDIAPEMPAPFPKCDPTNRTAIPAVTVSEGTTPAGSTWMRNPIPACGFPSIIGGAGHEGCGLFGGSKASDYQFKPPGDDASRAGRLLGGFGAGECYVGTGALTTDVNKCVNKAGQPDRDLTLSTTFQFNIVDKVRIPMVEPGEYIMSFRWEGEQTNQIWSTCSDVTIVSSKTEFV